MSRINFLLAAMVAMLVTAEQSYPEDPPMLIDKVIPFQDWKPHGSSVTGVVFTSPATTGNLGINWGRGMVEHIPYWFSTGGSSPQVLYWPSKGEGQNYLRNWNVPTQTGGDRKYDASMYTPTTPNTYGLKDEIHVVQLEVNDGYGSPEGVHFVATNATVVGKKTKTLLKMRRKINSWLKRRSRRVQGIMQRMEKKIMSDNPGGTLGREKTQVGEYPTYTLTRDCLVVTFYSHTSNTVTFPAEVEYRYCPPGAPCPPPQSTQRVITFGAEQYQTLRGCRGDRISRSGVAPPAKYIKEHKQPGYY